MKTTEITNEQLLKADSEFQQISTIGLGLLLMDRIAEFYKKNGDAINKVRADVDKVQREYLEYDGDTIKMTDGKPVFIKGKPEKNLNEEFKKIMSVKVKVEILEAITEEKVVNIVNTSNLVVEK